MKLKLKKHYYEGVSDYEIEVPDDTVFIYVDGDVGRCLNKGFNHYLGITTKKMRNNYTIYSLYTKLPGITFVAFDNVIFESDITIINSEEFYNRFNIGSYYIFKYLAPNLEFFYNEKSEKESRIIPPKLLSISKILEIKSQNIIKLFTANLNSWIGDREYNSIIVENYINLDDLFDDHFKCVIKQNAEQEFINAINETLSFVNYKAVSDQPSD